MVSFLFLLSYHLIACCITTITSTIIRPLYTSTTHPTTGIIPNTIDFSLFLRSSTTSLLTNNLPRIHRQPLLTVESTRENLGSGLTMTKVHPTLCNKSPYASSLVINISLLSTNRIFVRVKVFHSKKITTLSLTTSPRSRALKTLIQIHRLVPQIN